MVSFKPLAAALAGAAALVATAFATDLVPCPDDYASRATTYVASRLENPTGAQVQVVSEPYKIRTAINGRPELLGWGVDIRVRARQASGAPGVYLPYTVIFVDGAPVALCDDASQIERV